MEDNARNQSYCSVHSLVTFCYLFFRDVTIVHSMKQIENHYKKLAVSLDKKGYYFMSGDVIEACLNDALTLLNAKADIPDLALQSPLTAQLLEEGRQEITWDNAKQLCLWETPDLEKC
jgi:hypothetical protein